MSRQKQISAIHAIKNKLKWDEATYRRWLFEHSGEQSCSDMDDAVLERVYKEMLKLQPKGDDWRAPRIAKIKTLWGLLHRHGIVKQDNETAMRNWCKRASKADRLEWATAAKLDACIEGLKKWAEREGFGVRYVGEHRHTELYRLG